MSDYKILPDPLVRFALLRGGVFTNTEAHRFGIHEFAAATAAGECFRVRPGIYSLEAELDAAARVWAGLKLAAPDATLGLGAAAWVRGQGPEPQEVDIWCGSRNLKDRGPWRFHKGDPDEVQSCEAVNEAYGALLVARSPDLGLARRLGSRALRLTDRERFLEMCTTEVSEGRSLFETVFNRDVALAHGLPVLDWEPTAGEPPHLVRATVRGVGVQLGFDGSVVGRFLRRNYGWGRSRVPNEDPDQPQLIAWEDVVDDPCLVAGRVARRLRAAGWQGELLDCRQCTTSPSEFSMMRENDRRSLTECAGCGAQLVQLWRMGTEAALR